MTRLRIETPRVFKPLLTSEARYLGAYGGRGSAKSHFFASLAVEMSLLEKCDIVCIREVQKTLDQSVKKLIEVKANELGVADRFRFLRSHIESDLGGVITFQGMQDHTADSIKSLEGYKYAWVEEAQTLSQRSLDLLRPTLRMPGSQLWFSWNPNFESDPVDVLLRGPNPPPGSVVVKANWSDNPWFPDVLKAELEYDRQRDPEKFQHIWLGEYQRNSSARVFRNWKVEEFERPEGTIYRMGADWGYAIDPSVLVRCSVDGKRLYIDHEAYMIGCDIDQLPDLFDRVPESRKWFITADSARPETIAYMRKNGYPKMNAAIKGAKSVEEGIAFLQSYDIIVHPRCQHVIDELTMYSYKVDPLTAQVLPILEDKNNHCMDALRYACEGIRKAKPAGPEYDFSRPPSGASLIPLG